MSSMPMPCACCEAEATHRGSDGFFRCELHRLNGDVAPFDTEHLDGLRLKIEAMDLAIRFGGCSSVHAATLRQLGGGWAVDAQQAIDGVRLKLARLAQAAKNYRLHFALDGERTADVLDQAIDDATN